MILTRLRPWYSTCTWYLHIVQWYLKHLNETWLRVIFEATCAFSSEYSQTLSSNFLFLQADIERLQKILEDVPGTPTSTRHTNGSPRSSISADSRSTSENDVQTTVPQVKSPPKPPPLPQDNGPQIYGNIPHITLVFVHSMRSTPNDMPYTFSNAESANRIMLNKNNIYYGP